MATNKAKAPAKPASKTAKVRLTNKEGLENWAAEHNMQLLSYFSAAGNFVYRVQLDPGFKFRMPAGVTINTVQQDPEYNACMLISGQINSAEEQKTAEKQPEKEPAAG